MERRPATGGGGPVRKVGPTHNLGFDQPYYSTGVHLDPLYLRIGLFAVISPMIYPWSGLQESYEYN